MIRPAKKYEGDGIEFTPDFVALDIENDKDGSVLAIDICWRGRGELCHARFATWREFVEWLIIQAGEDTRFRTIYAHNGGGWDWISLIDYLMGEGKREDSEIEIARAQSTMILMQLRLGVNKDEESENFGDARLTIKFCDSLYLLRSKLDKLSEAFIGRGKTETDIEEVWRAWREDKPRFYKYLEGDTENLLLVLEAAYRMIRNKVAPIKELGLTIGATAMIVWRTGFLDREITVPTERKVKEFLREGFRGGRVEVFKYGYFPAVNVYDINSLYPTAMIAGQMPCSDRGDWTSIFRKKLPGCYRIRFRQRRRDILPVLMIDGAGAFEGVGVYFSPEINLLMEIDPGAKIEVIDGYVFHQYADLFSGYVNRLYNLRLSDPDGPISLLAKYLLNSLYGKFSQKARREQLVIFESNKAMNDYLKKIRAEDANKPEQSRRRVSELSPDSPVSAIEFEREVAFEHVGIAGMITSQARVILYRYLLKAGCQNVIYSDTDSIHCLSVLPQSDIGANLGQVKKEASGEGVYCGKKLYAIRDRQNDDPKKREKIRAKGITVGGRNGSDISFDDFCRVANGAAITCHFSQSASVLDVLRGKDTPCRIGGKDGKENRRRTIQKLDGTKKTEILHRFIKR
jgi:hypothetical protein